MHRMRFIRRVEALAHAEPRDFRRIERQCAKCSSSHYSWFETTVPIAIAAIENWAEWLQKEPYEHPLEEPGDMVLFFLCSDYRTTHFAFLNGHTSARYESATYENANPSQTLVAGQPFNSPAQAGSTHSKGSEQIFPSH